MKHLVLSVSPDSSLELLGKFADIIILDKQSIPSELPHYESMYIRSHFSHPETLPQKFQAETEQLVARAKEVNPNIAFIDNMDTVDKIVAFEDKWLQYKTYSKFMTKTQLLNDTLGTANFVRPVFKNRLSSRGAGVTWDINKATGHNENWIVQETLDIAEELRIYVIRGNVHRTGTVRQSKTTEQGVQAVGSRELTQDEINFAFEVGQQDDSMDMLGLDIARTKDGELCLIEVNRSPGFAAFAELTGVNLAATLYG